jgi:DNA-binding HxlR family transcriptional regulator
VPRSVARREGESEVLVDDVRVVPDQRLSGAQDRLDRVGVDRDAAAGLLGEGGGVEEVEVGPRNSPAVIRLLAERSHGFNELGRSIEGISRRMLTRTLRALEEDGFVARTSSGPAPARVAYSLTERGRSLREQLAHLGRWAASHTADLP